MTPFFATATTKASLIAAMGQMANWKNLHFYVDYPGG
jgi:hypothetical protein